MSVPVSLRDELAALIMEDNARPMGSCSCSECGEVVANAVLGSEALQSIRRALRSFVEEDKDEHEQQWLALIGIAPSVIRWVMGDSE